MSEDVYVLKYVADENIIELLNETAEEEYQVVALMNAIEQSPTEKLDEVSDWIAALKSGKKIVNPLSLDEELKQKYIKTYDANWANKQYREGYSDGMRDCLKIVSKKHPDVADWLSDRDG